MATIEVIKFEFCELAACDKILLSDSMLKSFCNFITDQKLYDNDSLVKSDKDASQVQGQGNTLSVRKQVVLAQSCMADVLYSIHFLGLWCAKRTVKSYLTEFARLMQNNPPAGDLISATLTILNHVFGRLDEIRANFENIFSDQDFVLKSATPQLQSLLHYIKDFMPAPNSTWPICIVYVRKKVIAKTIALWLKELASNKEEYSFIKPNYIVGTSRKHRNKMAIDNFDLHHEASIKDFRSGKCNVLVVSTVSERFTEMLRCNLVVALDFPSDLSEFVQAKANCRHDSGKFVVMMSDLDENPERRMHEYARSAAETQNEVNRRDTLDSAELDIMKNLEEKYGPYPKLNISKTPATIYRSLSIINKYCTKLPGDSFTRLAPEWHTYETLENNTREYYCMLRLPINSPIRQPIIGPKAATKNIAMRLAAYAACKLLYSYGELDHNMLLYKKGFIAPWVSREPIREKLLNSVKRQSVGSTKHRQYYKKRIAKVFSGPLVSDKLPCFLYTFKMVLTCPIPDEQNRRGRRIVDPSETNRNYAIVCTGKLPKICSFPVFTRSGEVMISVDLVKENFNLKPEQVQDLRTFHMYTFSRVLKLEKYPTTFNPDNSPFTILLAPVLSQKRAIETQIDWDFVDKIVKSDRDTYTPDIEARKNFQFDYEKYTDSVVIPWYRLTDRQQFAYYVAEICSNMTPCSPFPDTDSGFATFLDYYESKYNICIYNKQQPVLDVDHTSARLNLLTPRYVNRKGRTLPSSTAKTRRESRESLVQKQLLIPELCTIHPFPASFWRKAVCLPCIFYRLNSLFLAEELRREVARDIQLSFVEPPKDFEWPPLDFGWSLKDVISNQTCNENSEDKYTKQKESLHNDKIQRKKLAEVSPKVVKKPEPTSVSHEPDGDNLFVIDYFDPSKYHIPTDIPLDAPNEEWMTNIKLISTKSSSDTKSGWDQPIEQRDLFIQHTNEITWDDCEMEFDGEITEKLNDLRCGSPSSFEPNSFDDVPLDPNKYSVAFDSAPPKYVTFATTQRNFDSESQNSGNRDGSPASSIDGYSGHQKIFNNTDDTDSSSWCLTDDDAMDVEEEEFPTSAGYNWRDTKLKSAFLLRELFVPYVRPSKQIEWEMNGNFGGRPKSVEPTCESLNIVCVKSTSSQHLRCIMNEVFEDEVVFTDEDTLEQLNSWLNMIRKLDHHVSTSILDNPDMFKDYDIELVPVDDSLDDYHLEMQPAFGQLLPNRDKKSNESTEGWKNIKFDPLRSELNSHGPGPSVILQALTMSNASDGINLERLETVGDSFLKYSITAYLYCMFPSLHEGKLSYMRSTEISNANLYRLGKSKNLGDLMSATKFEPNDNWLPPGYTVAEPTEPCVERANSKEHVIDKALAEVPYDLLRQHSIPDKSIADCVEALIGAYLTASGSRAALLFMRWLGLSVMPETFHLQRDIEDKMSLDEMWRWLPIPKSPLVRIQPSCMDNYDCPENKSTEELLRISEEDLMMLYKDMNQFEIDIQYTFRDKAYLVQAFTHNSYSENYVTDCHQRLEFLGDALLDYLITRYLFEDPRSHSPGTLTDLRSALVNNTFFASLAVKYQYHKYLKHYSGELRQVIDSFVKKFRFDNKNTITKGYTLLINEGESEYAEDIEVPKVLGDVFESVAGAIYLDSFMSLDQVWKVYFRMMKPEIEYFSSHVPKSPIRELLESMPQNVRFSPSELAPDRKHRVTAEVFGLGRFTGVGRNKHSAKSTAAKRALRMLAVKKRKQAEAEKTA